MRALLGLILLLFFVGGLYAGYLFYTTIREIVAQTGTSQSNISQHLEQLRNKNILSSRKEANRIYYRIRNGKLLELIGTLRGVLCPANLDDRYDR